MKILITLVIIIGVIGLILTLIAANTMDTDYSSRKSFSNLSIIYILAIPVMIIGGLILWFIF